MKSVSESKNVLTLLVLWFTPAGSFSWRGVAPYGSFMEERSAWGRLLPWARVDRASTAYRCAVVGVLAVWLPNARDPRQCPRWTPGYSIAHCSESTQAATQTSTISWHRASGDQCSSSRESCSSRSMSCLGDQQLRVCRRRGVGSRRAQ